MGPQMGYQAGMYPPQQQQQVQQTQQQQQQQQWYNQQQQQQQVQQNQQQQYFNQQQQMRPGFERAGAASKQALSNMLRMRHPPQNQFMAQQNPNFQAMQRQQLVR